MKTHRWRALAAGLAVALPGAARAEKIAITGGRLVAIGPAGTIEGGTVLIDGHRISAVGRDLPVPAGYRVIDASGRWVTPGLMPADSRIGVEELSSRPRPPTTRSTPAGPASPPSRPSSLPST